MKQKAVIIGAGDFAKKVIRLAQRTGKFKLIGYTNPTNQGRIFNVDYLGTDDELVQMVDHPSEIGIFIGIAGNMHLLEKREKLINDLKKQNFVFPNLIADNAFIEDDVILGEGIIVFDNSHIDFGVNIGSYSVINLNCLVLHGAKIGAGSVISPNSTMGGGSKVGNYCFVGLNTIINPYCSVGDHVVIGSGGVVVKNCLEKGVYVGNPVKKIK